MKDAQLAIEMLHGARRRLITIKRCEGLLETAVPFSPSFIGLAYRCQLAHKQAKTLIQAARMVHPATTPKGGQRKRPVPPKTGPAIAEPAQRVPLHSVYFSNPRGPGHDYIRNSFLETKHDR